MKRLLPFFAVGLIACFCRAQEQDQPGGFMGVAWGSSTLQAKDVLNTRTDLNLLGQAGNELTYSDGTFAGFPVMRWQLQFAGDKFYQATVWLVYSRTDTNPPDVEAQTLEQMIDDKYHSRPRVQHQIAHYRAFTWTAPSHDPTNGNETIRLYYDWVGHTLTVTYTDQHYQQLGSESGPAIEDL
jgi:hypothetical protein